MLPRFQASLLPFPVERERDEKRDNPGNEVVSSFAHLDNRSRQQVKEAEEIEPGDDRAALKAA